MKETHHRIKGEDNNFIYGKLRSSEHSSLIIHIHGLTHNMNHMLEVMAADYFPDHGYDHFRFSLYAREPDSRHLPRSSLSTHIVDIHTVHSFFKNKYEHIFITAHSLGALCVLIEPPENITSYSLWDPAFDVPHFWDVTGVLKPISEPGLYHLDYGNVFVLGEDMVSEIKKYPDQSCKELAKAFSRPAQLIIPELSIFAASPHTSPEAYQDAFDGPCEISYIQGADHIFSNQGNQQALFKETLTWFDKNKER